MTFFRCTKDRKGRLRMCEDCNGIGRMIDGAKWQDSDGNTHYDEDLRVVSRRGNGNGRFTDYEGGEICSTCKGEKYIDPKKIGEW